MTNERPLSKEVEMDHWQMERMHQLKMLDIEREIEQARLLREASLAAGPSLLERIVAALRKMAKRRERGLASGHSVES
ncbi:MAG: hypothetical protein ACM3QS_06545, partial [Bacteroidota bacterium]